MSTTESEKQWNREINQTARLLSVSLFFLFFFILCLQSKSQRFSRRHRQSEYQVKFGPSASSRHLHTDKNTHGGTHSPRRSQIYALCLPLNQCFSVKPSAKVPSLPVRLQRAHTQTCSRSELALSFHAKIHGPRACCGFDHERGFSTQSVTKPAFARHQIAEWKLRLLCLRSV